MSFEDRLRDHLNDQGATIQIIPEGPDAAVNRHVRRARNRMAASAVAIALVLVGGFGLWSLADRLPSQETTVTGEPDAREPAIRENVDGEESESADADVDDPTLLSTRLEVVERVDENAPGGAWDAKVDNGIYYVLATAPGQVGLSDQSDANFAFHRPNTIYRFDPDAGWTNAEIADRWISDFTPSQGILYAISTGRTDGTVDAAIGESTDQGASWAWTSVPELNELASDSDEYGFSQTTMRLIAVDGRNFVLAQRMGWPEWDEAITLALDAGIDATRAQITHVDPNGLTYDANLEVSSDPCRMIMDRHYEATNEIWAADGNEINSEEDYRAAQQRVQPLLDAASVPFEQELVDAGCRNEIACQRIMDAYWSIGSELYDDVAFADAERPDPELWFEIEQQVSALRTDQAPRLEAELEAAGCENLVRCELVRFTIQQNYNDEQLTMQLEYSRYDELSEDEIRDLSIREQALWARIEAETQPALAEAGCFTGEGVYDEGPELAPVNLVSVTWDELGVSIPDSWKVTSEYSEHRDGQLITLDPPFEGEIVVNISSGPQGTELLSVPQDLYYGYDGQGPGSVWRTSDGVSWSRAGSSDSPFGNIGPGPFTVGDVSLRVSWEEPEIIPAPDADFPVIPPDAEIFVGDDGQPYFIDETGSSAPVPPPSYSPQGPPGALLERSIAGGPWGPIDVGALVPGLEGAVTQVYESEIGLSLIVRPPNDDDESQIVYTSDGVTWNVVTIDADYVSVVSAGDSTLFIGSRIGTPGEVPGPAATVLLRPAR